MCNFKILKRPDWSGLEYTTYIEVDSRLYIFAFDGSLKRQAVEITEPCEKELYQILDPDCVKKLKVKLWNIIKLSHIQNEFK
ncbi:hypothetical protein PNF31_27540 [Priestia megaterium]|uniref:hypothetical protein n=1 Tax=Priestia megaterium TaxID=1404 RepID=UPI00234FAC5D|nr:hypothetical protein [Priestia megaterium]MDC7724458.1 hypothetical protein [Priestia megaterium]